MSKNIIEELLIEELLREINYLIEKSDELGEEATKHLENGNELEWEEAKMESVEKEAYARGIKYALVRLGLI